MRPERRPKVMTIRTRLGDDQCIEQCVKELANRGQLEIVSKVASMSVAQL